MCTGSGKHDLKPPDGKLYRMVSVDEDFIEDVTTYDDELESSINEVARMGYKLVSLDEKQADDGHWIGTALIGMEMDVMSLETNSSGETVDLCPACNGSGSHTLRAPDGKNIVVLSFMHETGRDECFLIENYDVDHPLVSKSLKDRGVLRAALETRANELVSQGYEIFHVNQPHKTDLWRFEYHLRWRFV